MSQTKEIRIQSKVDTKAEWGSSNLVLLDQEVGYERETGKYKIGDGIHGWNDLPSALPIYEGDTDNALIHGRTLINWNPAGDDNTGINDQVVEYIQGNKPNSNYVGIKTIEENGVKKIMAGAFGENSVAFSTKSQALGGKSFAEGSKTIAFDNNSHAEGNGTFAVGQHSHSEGSGTTSIGNSSHAEGRNSIAQGPNTHAEGLGTQAWGNNSHSEGFNTIVIGNNSHAEGYETVVQTDDSHAEGIGTVTGGGAQHVQGKWNQAMGGDYAHVVGNGSDEHHRTNAHTLDWDGNAWFAGGISFGKENPIVLNPGNGAETLQSSTSKALSDYSIALGRKNISGCKGYYIQSIDTTNKKIYLSKTKVEPAISTTNNINTSFETPEYDIGAVFSLIVKSQPNQRHHYQFCASITSIENNVIGYDKDLPFTEIYDEASERTPTFFVPSQPTIGNTLISYGEYTEGYGNVSGGRYSHSEGGYNIAAGDYSHAEGLDTQAGYAAHSEGEATKAYGYSAHSEGQGTEALGHRAHAEGYFAKAYGINSHAEGRGSEARGENTHAEGFYTRVSENAHAAHAEGYWTVAGSENQHVQGKYNITDTENKYAHITGNGYIDDNEKVIRRNAHTLDWEGNAWFAGNVRVGVSNERLATTTELIGAKGSGSKSEIFNYANNTAIGAGSHAEGYKTTAEGIESHAEGSETYAKGGRSHAEGSFTQALGWVAHAEGHETIAKGSQTHSEGSGTLAIGAYSHAEGHKTVANSEASHVQGRYNILDTQNKYAHIVGNGTNEDEVDEQGKVIKQNRSNAHTLDWEVNAWFAVTVEAQGIKLTTKNVTITPNNYLEKDGYFYYQFTEHKATDGYDLIIDLEPLDLSNTTISNYLQMKSQFDDAEFIGAINTNGYHVLIVTGKKPSENIKLQIKVVKK